jgi:hypothetical protein
MHELAHRRVIRSGMHSDPQCRVNVLLQQGEKVVDGALSHPMRWIHSALLLILRQFRCPHVYPWNGRLGSLWTHLFFSPLPSGTEFCLGPGFYG